MNAQDSKQRVIDFLNDWSHRDVERLVGYFTSEAVYHNVPVAPIHGTDAIRAIFAQFLATFREISLDVVRIAAEPGLVLVERVDRFAMPGKRFELPVNGVFELQGQKIVRFSDYFDLATFERLSGLQL